MSNYIFPDGKYGEAAEAAYNEVKRAIAKHPSSVPFACRHQAYAVLFEEVDELWDDIKANNHKNAVKEAIQVAAMAIRFAAEFGEYPYDERPKVVMDQVRIDHNPNNSIASNETATLVKKETSTLKTLRSLVHQGVKDEYLTMFIKENF